MSEDAIRAEVSARMSAELDRSFMRAVGFTTSNAEPQPPLTAKILEMKIRDIMRDLGPPPAKVLMSEHATALPSQKPRTLDMQLLVERVGQQRVPAAFKMHGSDGDLVVVHPDFVKHQET